MTLSPPRAMWTLIALCCACNTAHVENAKSLDAALPPALSRMNDELRRAGTEESIGGLRVADPFRALEHDDARTQAWLRAQSERTEHDLAALSDPKTEARLHDLLSIGNIGDIAMGGTRVFFSLREGARERAALYMIDSAQSNRESVLAKPPLVDPQTYGERAALDYMFPSNDGRYVAFGISDNGDERATLRVYDLEQQRVLPDSIEHAKWSTVEWLNDASGFYYRRYPQVGEANWNEQEPDSYYARLFVHRLGQPAASDPLVFSGEEPIDFPGASIDADDRYLTITNQRTWTASDVWLWDRGESASSRAAAPKPQQLVPIVRGEDKASSGSVHDGQLYLLTNIDAPKKRLLRVNVESAADRTRWQTVVPESNDSIEDAVITHGFIVVHKIENVRSKLEVFTRDGQARGEIALPDRGSIAALTSSTRHDRIAFVWSSFLHAPTLFTYDLSTNKLETLYEVQHDFPASRYELHQESVSSKDGTPINVYYVARRGFARDGQNPVLLQGYGGFDISLLPSFSRNALYFLEQGGVFAQANLRGGGEFGEGWHRAGMLDQKLHVFEDFEAVTRWFSSSGISSPARIAISGGSNGGLLMGAMITRAPSTFAAATSYVGLYDMLRYPQFPPAAVWISEYGDPNDPQMARYLAAYSPYHNVRDHTAYPAALIETADHDTRVFWGHSAKFAARLQSASSGAAPIYFYMERSMGHGHGSGVADLVQRYARQYAFLRGALRLPVVH